MRQASYAHPPAAMYDLYERMRESCPVGYSEEFGGFFMLSRYEDVRAAAKDWETFSSASGVLFPHASERLAPLEFDPPEHSHWRGAIADQFGVSGMRRIEPLVREQVREILDGLGEEFDFAHEVSQVVPITTLAHLFGASDEAAKFRELTQTYLSGAGTLDGDGMATAVERFRDFLHGHFQARKAEPREDVFTAMATFEIDGKPVEFDNRMFMFLVSMITAGNLTTQSTMSSTVMHLAMDPELRARLSEEPKQIPRMIEEVIRLHTPSHFMTRTTTRDVEISGTEIPKGCPVALLYASANRDADQFEDPDELSLDRGSNPHLGFGAGIHRCAGAPLARMQIRVVVEELLDRYSTIELTRPDEVEYCYYGVGSMGMKSLPVRMIAR